MQNGKGDTPRPVDQEKYGSNFDRIFKKDTDARQNSLGSGSDRRHSE